MSESATGKWDGFLPQVYDKVALKGSKNETILNMLDQCRFLYHSFYLHTKLSPLKVVHQSRSMDFIKYFTNVF